MGAFMSGSTPITLNGKVVAVLPGTLFTVELQNGHRILGSISGKLRKNFIRLSEGDKVKIEMVPCDIHKGLIIARYRDPNDPPKYIPPPRQGQRRH
jgi:translation initiation factor IF-1